MLDNARGKPAHGWYARDESILCSLHTRCANRPGLHLSYPDLVSLRLHPGASLRRYANVARFPKTWWAESFQHPKFRRNEELNSRLQCLLEKERDRDHSPERVRRAATEACGRERA